METTPVAGLPFTVARGGPATGVVSSCTLTTQAHNQPLMPPIQSHLFELLADRFHVGIGGGESADGGVLRVTMICDFPRR